MPSIPPAESRLLVGRDRELLALEEWFINGHGPLVISGHGGIGKTALAREFGRAKEDVCFVDCSSATSIDHVLVAIRAEAQIDPTEQPTFAAIRSAIRKKDVSLLVLDNVEQLGDEIASLDQFLDFAPHVLLTSRTQTDLFAETQLVLGPLDVANDWNSAAIRLLSARSKAFGSAAAQIDPRALEYFHRIALISDGVPLALELAASKIATFGPEWTADRIERGPLDVGRGSPGKPPRQRTMDESIEWSWRLLADEERRALAWLSLFSNMFTIHEANALLGEIIPNVENIIERLVAQSLALPVREHAATFRLLVPIREFSRRRLEGEDLELAYRAYTKTVLLTASREIWPFFGIKRRESSFALERRRTDFERVVEPPAGIVPNPRDALLALEALSRLALASGSSSSYRSLVDKPSNAPLYERLDKTEKGIWLRSRAAIEHSFGKQGEAIQTARASLELLEEPSVQRCATLIMLARTHGSAREYDSGYTIAHEALSLAHELGDAMLESDAARVLSHSARWLGYIQEALMAMERGYDLSKKLGYEVVKYTGTYGLALLAAGQLDTAELVLKTVVDEDVDPNQRDTIVAYVALADVLMQTRQFERASALYDRALRAMYHFEIAALGSSVLVSRAMLDMARDDIKALAEDVARIHENRAADFQHPLPVALRAVVAFRTGSTALAASLAEEIYALQTPGFDRKIGRTILLSYELSRFEASKSEEDANAVRATIHAIFEKDEHGSSWHSQNADVRSAFIASASRLAALGFEKPSNGGGGLVLEISSYKGGRRAKLGDKVVADVPLAPFLILRALGKRDAPSISIARAFEIGWTGDVATPVAARNRVYVAISYLRTELLGPLLIRSSEGYLIDPVVNVMVSAT